MPGLLTLSFHDIGNLLVEDLLFKQHALGTGLLDVDVLESAGDLGDLAPRPGVDRSGIGTGTQGGIKQITFHTLGRGAWTRAAFNRPSPQTASALETWLKKAFSKPITCLVLSGHHGLSGLFGPGVPINKSTLPSWAQFAPEDGTTIGLEGPAFDGRSHSAGPFDMKTALSTCRLLVILGCNGASIAPNAYWRRWRNLVTACAGKPPLVLGWWNKHNMPRAVQNHFSPLFWHNLKDLATGQTTTLDAICDKKPDAVITAWADTMKATYKDTKCTSNLWFVKGVECGINHGPRGAGAVHTDGGIWNVVSNDGPIKQVG